MRHEYGHRRWIQLEQNRASRTRETLELTGKHETAIGRDNKVITALYEAKAKSRADERQGGDDEGQEATEQHDADEELRHTSSTSLSISRFRDARIASVRRHRSLPEVRGLSFPARHVCASGN